MKTRPCLAITLGLLAWLVASEPASAQSYPISARRLHGGRPTTTAFRTVATRPVAASAVAPIATPRDPIDSAWREFAPSYATTLSGPRPSAARTYDMAVFTSASAGHQGRTCTPSRASMLAIRQTRPAVVREEPAPPPAFVSWGNR